MNKIFFLLTIALFFCTSLIAGYYDSLTIQTTLQRQEEVISKQNSQILSLQSQVKNLKSENKQLHGQICVQQTTLDSLSQIVHLNTQNIKATADELGIQIKTTNSQITGNANRLTNSLIYGGLIALFILLTSLGVTFLFRKQSDKNIKELKQQADELNEKIVSQLTNEISEIQKIVKVMHTSPDAATSDNNHDLIKALADRITFMEMTLYKMDSGVPGRKQLSRTIEQMKDNLLAYGYEIVSMLGMEYNDGMKVTVNFVEDENVEQGKQIITGIIKPQINYNGKMIQSAQITVSQNI